MSENLRFGLVLFLLGGTFCFQKISAVRGFHPLAQPLTAIDTEIHGWVATDDPPLTAGILASLDATAILSRTYRRREDSLNLWIAFYANQRAGETMHSPKYCLPGSGWDLMAEKPVSVDFGGRTVWVNNYLLTQAGNRRRMLYWYQGPARVIASEYTGKMLLIWDALRYGQTSGSLVRIVLADDPARIGDAVEFSRAVMSQVSRCFGPI